MGLTRSLTRGLTVPLTTRLNVRPGFSGASAPYHPATALTNPIVYDASDLTSLRAARDGSGAQSTVGGFVGWRADVGQLGGLSVADYLTANPSAAVDFPANLPGYHQSAPADDQRPTLAESGGVYSIKSDLVNDQLRITGLYLANERYTVGLAYTDLQLAISALLSHPSANDPWLLSWESGSAIDLVQNSGHVTLHSVKADGSDANITTRGTLYTSLSAANSLLVDGTFASTWTGFDPSTGLYGGGGAHAPQYQQAMVIVAAPSGLTTEQQANLTTWLGSRAGVTL